MSDERRRIDALLDAALDLPAEQRQAFLDREAPDGPIREGVDRLLESTDGIEDTVDLADGALIDVYQSISTDLRAEPAKPGDRIGPFQVVRELGRGGMAAVYLAERADGQLEQKVALKLSQHVASEVTLQRFHQERQILASLEHPSIARLIDAGLTDGGRPYFAMEVVDGETIDVYCDLHRLTVAERLGLFIEVGQAIEAAHRALVVHRDIKPANVMVSSEGRVKLLDFGIAKLLDEQAAPAITATSSLVMTPDYASPEQYLGEPVTTASDVYQLGLLLYELLVGRPPYRVSTLSPLEALRAVCEDEPTRPSIQLRRISTSAPTRLEPDAELGRALADRRRATVEALSRELKGDLDTIVLKALRKEPERRYGSAAELVADIEHYLAGRPVSARGDSLAYRGRKFVMRHRLGVAMGLISTVALAGQLAFYTERLQEERNTAQVEASRARRAQSEAEAARLQSEQSRDEAEEVVAFLQSLFAGSESGVQNASEISARELLDRGIRRIRDELEHRPVTRARLLATIAEVSRRIGLFEEAEAAAREAADIRQRELGPQHADTAESLHELAAIYRARGKLEEAAPLYQQSLEIRRSLGQTSGPVYWTLLKSLALLELDRGHFEKAEALFEELRTTLGQQSPEQQADFHNNYGNLLNAQGRYQEAEKVHRQALELRIDMFGPEHLDVSGSYNNLAIIADHLGRTEEARDLQLKSLKIKEKVLGPNAAAVAGTLVNLSTLERDVGHPDRARQHLLRAIEIMGKELGPTSPRLANAYTNLASLDLEDELYDQAERGFRKALDIRRASLGDEHRDVGAAYLNLGEVYRHADRGEEAERAYLRSVDILEQAVGNRHPYFGYAWASLGKLYQQEKRYAEAVDAYVTADEVLAPRLGEQHADVLEIRERLEQSRRAGGS